MTAVKLDTTKLDALIASVPGRADELTRQAAFAVEAQTKLNIQRWPLIDTGALLNSIQAKKVKRGLWQVSDGVEYGVFWELGHKNIFLHRYVRKPFLGPAVQYVTAKFEQMIRQGLIK